MRRVAIHETPAGWLIGPKPDDLDAPADPARLFGTATEALAAVKREAADRVVETRTADVVVVEWHPTTRTGRIIVRAVAAQR